MDRKAAGTSAHPPDPTKKTWKYSEDSGAATGSELDMTAVLL